MKTAYIPAKSIDWILKATSDSSCRPALTDGAITWINGVSWLCATDTMRVHLIRLFKSEQHKTIVLNLRRIRHEMKFVSANTLLISLEQEQFRHQIGRVDWSSHDRNAVETLDTKKKSKWSESFTPLVNERESPKYPDIARVIPKKVVETNGVCFNVRSKYIADAGSLHVGGSLLAVADNTGRPYIAPIVVLPRLDGFNSFAVVMPMEAADKQIGEFNAWQEAKS